MTTYHEFCRLRDLHTPGANAPKHSEAEAFFMAAAQLAVPEGYKLVPLEPTPEIIAGAAVAIWPTASPADIALAHQAAQFVLMQMDMVPGTTADAVAGILATMAPAYRAMLAAAPVAPAQAHLAATSNDSFQARVQPWMLATFGPEIPADCAERNHRFLEESLELVQACGCTASEAHQLVDYVFGRPVGERAQEVGGVMVTLAALCLAQCLDMHAAGETELARIWTKVEAIRAKQVAKPKHSPLPAAAPQVVADERAAFVQNLALVINRLETISQNDTDIPRTLADEALVCARASLAAAPVQPGAVPDMISSSVIEVLEAVRNFIGADAVPADAKGASESAHQARKMAALIDSVLAHLPAAPAVQGDAKDTGTNDKALLDFMETDHRLHIATTYVGLSYAPTFEVAKMTGYIGNDQLTHISSGKTLREAIAAAIASSKAVKS